MKKYYIYILESQLNNHYYIGATNDVGRRVREHNNGRVPSTKSMAPWQLKYQESFSNLSLARQREKQIKSWKKRVAIKKLINAAIV